MRYCQKHFCNYGSGTNQSKCVFCEKERLKEYRIKNKEKVFLEQKEYRIKNKDKIREYLKEWKKNNQDKINGYRKSIKAKITRSKYCKNNKDKLRSKTYEWRTKNPGYTLDYMRMWRENNKEKVKGYNKKFYHEYRKRYARQRMEYFKSEHGKMVRSALNKKSKAIRRLAKVDNTVNAKSLRTLLAQQDNKCSLCKRNLITGNGTHLDHINPIFNGGKHTISNVRYLCQKCNLSRDYSEFGGRTYFRSKHA